MAVKAAFELLVNLGGALLTKGKVDQALGLER